MAVDREDGKESDAVADADEYDYEVYIGSEDGEHLGMDIYMYIHRYTVPYKHCRCEHQDALHRGMENKESRKG